MDATRDNPNTTLHDKIAASNTLIETWMSRRDVAVASFSGGKDSVVLAHLLLPWRHKVRLLYINLQHMYPHMLEFVNSYRDTYELVEIDAPNPLKFWGAFGTPHVLGNPVAVEGKKTFARHACCDYHLGGTYNAFLNGHPGTLAFDGCKRCDPGELTEEERRQVVGCIPAKDSHRVMDVTNDLGNPEVVIRVKPLYDWTDQDVFTYVQQNDLRLPMQYNEGVTSSLECIICPAMLTPRKFAFLRKHYPEHASFVQRLMERNLRSTYAAIKPLEEALAGLGAPQA